jgi:hypothetical protein
MLFVASPELRPSRARALLAVGLVAGSALALGSAGAGCSHDTDLSAMFVESGSNADGDALARDAGASITVTSFAPSFTSAPAMKLSATWAAYRLDDGEWHPLAPASEGTYVFPIATARWTLALVCASSDDALTTVSLHHRTNATPNVEVMLDDGCTPPPPPAEFTFTGNLTNLPATTQWLDFGYARDSRGVAIPVTGTTGTYEVVGIEPGTWDLAFGVRDEPFRPLTRFVMRRGEVVKGDEMIDVDVAGPGSFAPGTSALKLHALIAGDTVTPHVFYTSGGPFGIDVGPQDVPDREPDVTLAYSTVPDAVTLPGDRYRGEMTAEQDRRTGSRTVTFDLHHAVDLDMTFLPDPPVPSVTILGVTPHVRFETKFPVLADAERHEVLAIAAQNRRSQIAWRATYDAIHVGSAEELDDVMPDLSALPGWKKAWGLPAGITMTVLVTAYEKRQPVGDGTMQRTMAKGLSVTP